MATTTNTGTTSTPSLTWTTSNTSTSIVKLFPGPELTFKKAARIPTQRSPIKVVKDFWDDVEWKEYISYLPRKSITGKIIIGHMHKRQRTTVVKGVLRHKQFAKTKELFQEKLKGRA